MMKEITFRGEPVTVTGHETQAGQIAPDFTLTGTALNPVKLSDFKDKVKIISVFPSIDTGVCALQTKRFNREAAKLGDDIVILCVSKDLPFAQSRFCGAEGIDRVITLSDYKDNEFGEKYGFLLPELGLLTRGVIVVDKDNVVQYVEYVKEVAEEPDYNKAIEEAKSALHYATADLTAKLENIGLTAEQTEQTLSILKNHLEKRLPLFIKDHLTRIFEGEKLELSDILKNQAEIFTDEVKDALGTLADKTEEVSGKLSDKVEKAFGKITEFFNSRTQV
jgi:thiol peroxidase